MVAPDVVDQDLPVLTEYGQRSGKKDLLIAGLSAVGFIVFWLIMLCGPWNFISGFDQEDDFFLAAMTKAFSRGASFLEVLSRELESDKGQRFRPLWVLSRVIQARLFGINFSAYSIWNAVLLGLSSGALYGVGRLLKIPALISALMAVVIMMGHQLEAYIWRAPQESTAMFLLTLIMLAITANALRKGGKLLVVIAAILSLLIIFVKESFVITLPAIAAWRIVLLYREGLGFWAAVKKSLPWIIYMVLVMLLGIGLIITNTRITYLDAQAASAKELSMESPIVQTTIGLFKNVSILLTTVFCLLFLALPNWKARKGFGVCLLFLAGWLGPQLVLFRNYGFETRYLFPVIIGPWFVCYYLFSEARIYSRLLYNQYVLILSLASVYATHDAIKVTIAYGKWRKSFVDVLEDLRRHTSPDSKILVMADPSVNYTYARNMYEFATVWAGIPDGNMNLKYYPPPPYTEAESDKTYKVGVLSPLYRQQVHKENDLSGFDFIAAPADKHHVLLNDKSFLAQVSGWKVTSGQKFIHFRKPQ